MTEITDDLYCIGCGAKLQSADPELAGYIPASSLKKQLEENNEVFYCQRCFRLRHYNEITDIKIDDSEFTDLLNSLGQQKALIVNVVDLFDFDGSVIPGLHRFVGDNPVILVGNKADLLPKSVHRPKILNWLQQQAAKEGLHPVATLLTSAKKLYQVDELLATIEKQRHGQDVYVVGTTNVGKSTLINAIIKQTSGPNDMITTSRFPGTTLDQIQIPLADHHSLIDTPGIINGTQMAHFLDPKELRFVSPQSELRPRVFQLTPPQTLFLGGLVRIDFLGGKRSSLIVYVENNLLVHRTKTETADEFYQRQRGKLLVPPADPDKLPAFRSHEFTTKDAQDLVIAGLGWIRLPASSQFRVLIPEGVNYSLRTPIV
ncbi:ribosome biogenesis GTPase YqeH [Lapidilactobacillus mulanensis]|uniref:Ribosome biogenesis GTPase YqeH n=1 Tax=Lapidilactobacillus mulanensis TaxID=2485999 RepID=A0ABW4DRF9_9LACO|nr:ribosome biogenesis GTPase YqeH [Lapidilactobacillus mulanensis]